MTANLIAALLIGLSSSAHCVFMCGGIAASLGSKGQSSEYPNWLLTSLFHFGRLLSYAVIGLLLGFVVSSVDGLLSIGIWLRLIAGTLLIAMGLYLANVWRGLTYLERMMEPVWQPIARRLKQFIPAQKPRDAIITGLFWGWLPCGLVYNTLAWAVSANDPFETAALMFFMGLGSLPVLLGISFFGQIFRHRWAGKIGGIALCLFGIWTMAMPLMSTLPMVSEDIHEHHQIMPNH